MIIGSYPLVPISSLTIHRVHFIFRNIFPTIHLSFIDNFMMYNLLRVISFTIHRDNTIVGFTIDSYHCLSPLLRFIVTHTSHRTNVSFAFIRSGITKLTLLHTTCLL